MKITESKLRQVIREVINEVSTYTQGDIVQIQRDQNPNSIPLPTDLPKRLIGKFKPMSKNDPGYEIVDPILKDLLKMTHEERVANVDSMTAGLEKELVAYIKSRFGLK